MLTEDITARILYCAYGIKECGFRVDKAGEMNCEAQENLTKHIDSGNFHIRIRFHAFPVLRASKMLSCAEAGRRSSGTGRIQS